MNNGDWPYENEETDFISYWGGKQPNWVHRELDIKIDSSKPKEELPYKVMVFTEFGVFDYPVKTVEQGIEHCQRIMERGVYRRNNGRGSIDFYKVEKCRLSGAVQTFPVGDTFSAT